MRIISGSLKGRRFEIPEKFSHIRPTSERVREAVFNRLVHGEWAESLLGGTILDVCCGTGAMGFEALSRGAAHAVFIDSHADSLKLVEQAAAKWHIADSIYTQKADAAKLPRASVKATLAFLDPPYGKGLITPILQSLVEQHWLGEGAIIVVEHAEGESIALPPAYTLEDGRNYSRAEVKILRYTSPII